MREPNAFSYRGRSAKLVEHTFLSVALFACVLCLFARETHAQQPAADSPQNSASEPKVHPEIHSAGRLEAHQRMVRTLTGAQSDKFTVDVTAGQFLHVLVEKQGSDIALLVGDPAGRVVVSAFSPNGSFGPLPASVIAKVSGAYILKVMAFGTAATASEYSIVVTDLRPPSPQDEVRIEAETEFYEAVELEFRDSESRRKALGFLQDAAAKWRELNDVYQEGLSYQTLGTICSRLGEPQEALGYFAQALPIERSLGDQSGEATTFMRIGVVHDGMGEKQKALEYYEQALPLLQAVGDRNGEAAALSNIGKVYNDLGENQKALEYYKRALPVERSAGLTGGEGATLNNIGAVYRDLGDTRSALDYYEQAIPLRRAAKDQTGEATTLVNIGSIYDDLGEKQKALEYFQQALPVEHALGDPAGEAGILNNIGAVYDDLGEKQRALEIYGKALPLRRAAKDRDGEALTLSNVGKVYCDLGEQRKALEYFEQVLPIERDVGNRRGEATTLSNIGIVYKYLGEKQKALEYFQQALPIERSIGFRSGEAKTLNNIGSIDDDLGEKQKALEYYEEALPVERAVRDRSGEATTLNNIGAVYDNLGDKQKALEYYERALPIRRAVGDRSGEAVTLSWLCGLWAERGNVSLAIFFGKQSVNVYQSLRRDIQSLDESIQKTYLDSITGDYRRLADLLLSEDRLPEAEQVLGMLKEQEFKEFTRGAGSSPGASAAPMTTREQRAESILGQALEWQDLDQIANRTAAQQARYEELNKALTANNVSITNYWQALQTALPPREAHEEKIEASAAQKLLHKMPPGTIVVYTLVLDDELHFIVVSRDDMVQKSVAVKRADLAATVEEFRSAIQDRQNWDALLVAARKLYDWLVAPIAAELDGAHATTIAWSLDGVLRYMPVNALYDGRQFFIQRYTNVIFTPGDITGLEEKPLVTEWKALGLGISKQYFSDLNALPAVPDELRSIVRDPQDNGSHGPLPGQILLNDAYTEQAMEQLLKKDFPLVHIASHFVVGLTTDDSYLLLGGEKQGGSGYRLRLSDIETMNGMKFDSTALLSLSACETAMSNSDADGKEVDSLAAIGRERGAQAVLASLWDVNDASTGQLMADFYRRWTSTKGITKSEALRQAQLDLLLSSGLLRDGAANAKGTGRGVAPAGGANGAGEAPSSEARSYSHPYYWAPFILVGNWQ
jgi:CHAT domain-containing protein/Tfp pilus assembly protein PilF